MKHFTLYLLHSSHTDIGYTDTQEKMKAHHIAFIRQALALSKKQPRFKWNCESYWCVQQFLRAASETEKADFIEAVHDGRLCLSASYLNLTDLVPEYVHDGMMAKCLRERDEMDLAARSALTADINGYSWGFADILARHGVHHLMSCIHTHHGYHPLMRKQTPFWWEGPRGNRLLTWNGEHYNLGNELGIAGTPWFEYTLQDGMSQVHLPPYEKAVLRIRAYVNTLKAEGYEFDFAPVSVSSYMTDNAPPSLEILNFADTYNAQNHGITLKMATLDEFFAALKATGVQFPVYRGDWTDWWADGIGSTPSEVIQYRAAARSLHLIEKLDAGHALASAETYDAALSNLMFYGEHTWGYSSSITEPYHPQVNNLEQWKRLYALKAAEAATIAREAVQQHYGETAVAAQGELKFRAVNPHAIPVEHMLVLDLEHFFGHEHFELMDDATGESVPFQISRYSRGPEICAWLRLAPKETKTLSFKEIPAPVLISAGLCAPTGIEGVNDLNWRFQNDLARGGCVSPQGIENHFFRIAWEAEKGITSILDKKHGRELVVPARPYAAFTPVYEMTPRDMAEDYLYVRRNMGRNRKAFRTRRDAGTLYDVKVLENGPLYSRAMLKYRMAGVKECEVVLTAYKLTPRLDIDLRLHKDSVWEPENLYLSLPFAGDEIYIDKAGAVLRPRVDQLPGTCIDFYAIQNGIVFAGQPHLILTCPDAPLVSMGTLKAHPIRLMGEGDPNVDEVYSWVMNNFWETNFKASLGGFYQFHYTLALSEGTVPEAFEKAETLNEGVLQFYRFEDKA